MAPGDFMKNMILGGKTQGFTKMIDGRGLRFTSLRLDMFSFNGPSFYT